MHVEPKAMEVLVYLAEHAGQVVEREAILRAVWNGSTVKAEVLTNAIWELRKALGDDSREPDFIQTVSRKGYRLVARVESGEQPVRPSFWSKWAHAIFSRENARRD